VVGLVSRMLGKALAAKRTGLSNGSFNATAQASNRKAPSPSGPPADDQSLSSRFTAPVCAVPVHARLGECDPCDLLMSESREMLGNSPSQVARKVEKGLPIAELFAQAA
jgi:hypothetical protein